MICVSFVVGFALVGFVGLLLVGVNSVGCCHWVIVYFIFFGVIVHLLIDLWLMCCCVDGFTAYAARLTWLLCGLFAS